MSDSKTPAKGTAAAPTSDAAPVQLVATAAFDAPGQEGEVTAGQVFEATPERAAFLRARHLARTAPAP